jgi:hypothetical protein
VALKHPGKNLWVKRTESTSSYGLNLLVTSLRGKPKADVASKVPELCQELQLRLSPNCVTLTKKQYVVSITSRTEGWTIESSHTRRRELGASPISSESSSSLWFVVEKLPTTMVLFFGYPRWFLPPFLTASSGLNYKGNISIIWCFHRWK